METETNKWKCEAQLKAIYSAIDHLSVLQSIHYSTLTPYEIAVINNLIDHLIDRTEDLKRDELYKDKIAK